MANLKDLIVTGPARFLNKIYGNLEGNATSADKWKTARTFNISATPGSGGINVDGSQSSYSLVLPSTIGNFTKISATSFEGSLKGNADSASKLTVNAGDSNTPVYFEDGIPKAVTSIDVKSDKAGVLDPGKKINGTTFTGATDITTASWGTARTVTISDNDGTNTQANNNINGSANFTLKLPATIKATLSGKASTAGHADTASSATTAITCTGNAETASWLNANSSLTYGANGFQYFNLSGTEGTSPSSNNTPTSTWYHIMRLNHSNSDGCFADIAVPIDNTAGVWWRQIRYGTNYGWFKILDSNNYTEYTVTKTGGGASGTWGISISGKAASATRLATDRNIVLNGDFTGSASFNGTADATITATNYKCSVDGGNTNSFPYHRIAYITGKSGQYSDIDCILHIKHNYAGGGFGRVKIGFRTNSTGDAVDASATWLYKYNIRDDAISIAYWGVSGDNCYADVFYNHGILYPRCTVYQVYGNRDWTLVNSNQPYNSAAATEAYASISAAATALHGGTAYTNIVNSTQSYSSNYLPLSGGRLSGLLSAHGGISLNDSTPRETPQFILGIREFANGGNIIWQTANEVSVGKASALTPITTTDKADGTNDWRRVWFSWNDNTTGRPAYDDRFVFQTSTGTLKAPVFSGNKLYASSTDSDAIHTIGGILASYLRIDNANSGGYVELGEDGEGGNIRIIGPNGSKWWKIDCYNSSDLRIFSHDGSDYKFFVFGANGNLSAPSFSGNLNGNASTASALTPITDTDLASSADTWRRIWMGWADNTTGRPAYDDRFAIQTSTGTLKAPVFSGNLDGNAFSATWASALASNGNFSYIHNSLQYFNIWSNAGAAVGVNDTPTSNSWHILRCTHGHPDIYYTDVAIPFGENQIYYKRVMTGSIQNGGWVMLYDTQNIVYSASAPYNPKVGTIWLQPI